MTVIRPFDRSMIENYLESHELSYTTDQDGDFCLSHPARPENKTALSFWLVASGEGDTVLTVQVEPEHQVPQADWGRAVAACNVWNCDRRWPKAYLHVAEEGEAGDVIARIYLEGQIDLRLGVHQALVDDFIETIVANGLEFWDWAQAEGLTTSQ